MTKDEARLIKSRLDEYSLWQSMAHEADRASLMTQIKIEELGDIKSPTGNDGVRVQNPTPKSTIMNLLLSDQAEFEQSAMKYRYRMCQIEDFIERHVLDEKAELFTVHFVEGVPYDKMVPTYARSSTGIQSIIERELKRIDFSNAKGLI